MANPLKKIISNFQGGQVDYYSSRDLNDTQFQEITNADLHVPGRIKRPESDVNISVATEGAYYELGDSGNGFSVLNSEYSFGEDLLASVDITHVSGYTASLAAHSGHNFPLDRDMLVTTTSAHGFVEGDIVEIIQTTTVAEYNDILGIYTILKVPTTTTFVVYHEFLEATGVALTSATSISNFKVRKVHSQNPTVYGVLPVKIGKNIPTTRRYSETNTAPILGENAIVMSILDGEAITYVIDEGKSGHGIAFLPASWWVTNYPSVTDYHYDWIFADGINFEQICFKIGQSVTYTSTGLNGDTPNNNKTGNILSLHGNSMKISTIDNVVQSYPGFYSGTFTAAAAGWSDAKIDGWSDEFNVDVSAYSLAGAIRLCDSNFNNANHVNKWFGLIKGPRYGETVDYNRAPRGIASRPIQASHKHSWEMMSQGIPAPNMVKMDGCFDPTYKVKEAGDVGLFIYDPLEYSSVPESYQEHVLYPDAMVRECFDVNDRWATTFIYDGASESELSRTSDGSIGVSGFKTITPPDVLEEPVTYMTSAGDEIEVKVVGYTNNHNSEESRESTSLKLTSETDGSVGAHTELAIGDIVKVGSEKLCIVEIAAHSGTDAFVTFTVHRGVLGTSPPDLTELPLSHVEQNQKARAINIVIGTGSNTSAIWYYDDSGHKMKVSAKKSLGSLPNTKIKMTLNYNAGGGGGDSTISVAKTCDSGWLHLILVATKNSTAISYQDIVNAINGESPDTASGVAITQQNYINNYVTAELIDGVTGTDEVHGGPGGDSNQSRFFGDATTGHGVDGQNVDGLNKRITGMNLYWKPKEEVDWYLVQYYDIEKGWSNV